MLLFGVCFVLYFINLSASNKRYFILYLANRYGYANVIAKF